MRRAEPRVLVLLHVDWRWIKQRPHFLAEHLARRFPLLVAFRASPNRRRLPANPTTVRRVPLAPLPLTRSTALVAVQRAWVALLAGVFRPSVVWLTYPSLWPLVSPALRRRCTIVYDRMDRAGAFHDASVGARVERIERELLDAADVVLCSSGRLIDDLPAPHRAKAHLVLNAHQPGAEPPPPPSGAPPAVAYIGTISEWLDAMDVRTLTEAGIRVLLVGPYEKRAIEGVTYTGPVAHDRLPDVVAACHGLIMPFTDSPLVRGVDPIKLYEYLSFGRPVIARRYPGLERFEPYVHLYDTREQLAALAVALRDGTLPPRADATEFLKDNTWERRAEAIARILTGDAAAR